MSHTTISADRVRELIDQGHARPLLPGRFPVPVELDGRWWHVPAAAPAAAEEFEPAPAAAAAEFSRLAARRRAAEAAVARHDARPSR